MTSLTRLESCASLSAELSKLNSGTLYNIKLDVLELQSLISLVMQFSN